MAGLFVCVSGQLFVLAFKPLKISFQLKEKTMGCLCVGQKA